MPYYGSGIMEKNVNVLRGLAQDKERSRYLEEESKLNVLRKEKLQQGVDATTRKQLMEQHWMIGQALNSVSQAPSGEAAVKQYERVRDMAKELYGEAAYNKMPENYDPEWVKRQQAENNILYEGLGKGKPTEVTMTNAGETRTVKSIYGSPHFQRLAKAGWTQGALIKDDTEKGKGTEVERQAELHDMTVPEYRLDIKEKELKLKRKYGDLSERESRLAIQYSQEMNNLQRDISKEEAMLGNLEDPEKAFPGKVKRIKKLKSKLKATQKEYDRITKPGQEVKLKELDDATARRFFEEAGGDMHKAAELAREEGYKVAPFSGDYKVK